jgi:release factor glutamine methyltransferase
MKTRAEVMTFGGLEISWTPDVLAPRSWTVGQSEWAVELLAELPPGPVLELCAGGGQIGLVTVVRSGRALVAVDINPEAARCTLENARRAAVGHLVEARCASIDRALDDDERFPLVIADPPWVPSDRVEWYPQSPVLAIDGGTDGLQLARHCAEVMDQHLTPDGCGLLQLGSAGQVRELSRYLATQGMDLEVSDQRAFPRGILVLLRRSTRRRP